MRVQTTFHVAIQHSVVLRVNRLVVSRICMMLRPKTVCSFREIEASCNVKKKSVTYPILGHMETVGQDGGRSMETLRVTVDDKPNALASVVFAARRALLRAGAEYFAKKSSCSKASVSLT